MEADRRNFFMMSVEIRILASVLARISSRALEERFSAHNIDMSGLQYGILRTLGHENFTLSELSRRFTVDPSTLVPVIDTLERKGLVTRGKDPNDRRRIPLSLTTHGAQMIRDIPLIHEDDLLFQRLDKMGEDKALALRELLRDVVKGMPEGEEMLQSVTSRLYTLQDGEHKPEHCLPHPGQEPTEEAEQENEHHTRQQRTIRRRTRRERS